MRRLNLAHAINHRHPAEIYLRYLWAMDRTLTVEHVNDRLSQLGFNQADEEYLQELHAWIASCLPKDYDPKSTTHLASARVNKDLQISSMINEEQGAMQAFELLYDLKLRDPLEMLILATDNDQEVGKLLLSRVPTTVHVPTTRSYRHYFWNTELLGRESWRTYLTENGTEWGLRKYTALIKGVHYAQQALGLHQKVDWRWIHDRMVMMLYSMAEEIDAGMAAGPIKASLLCALTGKMNDLYRSNTDAGTALEEFYKAFQYLDLQPDQKALPVAAGQLEGQIVRPSMAASSRLLKAVKKNGQEN